MIFAEPLSPEEVEPSLITEELVFPPEASPEPELSPVLSPELSPSVSEGLPSDPVLSLLPESELPESSFLL